MHIPSLDFFGEGLIIEGRKIVGKAAIIDVDVNQLESTEGILPSGYVPNPLHSIPVLTLSSSMSSDFGQQASILNAGKHSAFLETEVELDDGSTEYHKGTAFFVSENLLLTAAHNVEPEHGRVTKISIRYEGSKKVEPTGSTLRCRVTAVMPKIDPSKYDPLEDLAILECFGHDSPHFLHLSTDELPPTATVHVIGYPGEITEEWLKARHPELDDYDGSNRAAAHKLLPQGMLTATEGKISVVWGGYAEYEISTVVGMSGGCLLYNGKVHGTKSDLRNVEIDVV